MKTYVLTDWGVRADDPALQTQAIQAVLDRCKEGGGTVVFPKGRVCTGGLRVWSHTTLQLLPGAVIAGSEDCTDYPVFDVPPGVELRTDQELIPEYYHKEPWPEYRRAIFSAYGERDITITGAGEAVIDGMDCYDGDGEEGFRGPHGIFFSNCENITLGGYTIQHCGNFMHQLDNCSHIRARDIMAFGGHDGFHLHCCKDIVIESCVFHTGDDCIAGINMEDLLVRRCELNTSCNFFRIGGVRLTVEDCRMFGPGIYPHRCTVVRGKNDCLPREAGRHNSLCLMNYFSSATYPGKEPSRAILFKNCEVENAQRLLSYHANAGSLQRGTHLTELTLQDVRLKGIEAPADVRADEKEPLTVTLYRVETSGCAPLFDGQDPSTRVVCR